jgi:hypothetical protein
MVRLVIDRQELVIDSPENYGCALEYSRSWYSTSFLLICVLYFGRPGGIAELTRIISNVGVSIKDIVHERAWVRKATFSVGVSI